MKVSDSVYYKNDYNNVISNNNVNTNYIFPVMPLCVIII